MNQEQGGVRCLRITVQSQKPKVRQPEAPSPLSESSGSAWVLDLMQLAECEIPFIGNPTAICLLTLKKKLLSLGVRQSNTGSFPVIVTNAHVVHGMRSGKFQFNDTPTPHSLRLLCFFHARDLAFLIPEDEALTDQLCKLIFPVSTKPIDRADILTVYGYPVGSKQVAMTEGKLSRMMAMTYGHPGLTMLGYEMTTTINSGSSGGPVVIRKEGTGVEAVVAISHQGVKGTANQFHAIPAMQLRSALQEWITYGREFGLLQLPINIMPLHHPAMREDYGLNGSDYAIHGTLISAVSKHHSFSLDNDGKNQCRVNDVLLSINGLPVDADGNLVILGERISFICYLSFCDPSRALDIVVLRGKERLQFSVYGSASQVMYRAYRLPSQTQAPTFYQHGILFSGEISANSVSKEFEKGVPSDLAGALGEFGGFRTPGRYSLVIFYPKTDTMGYALSEINVVKAISVDGKTVQPLRDIYHLWHILNPAKGGGIGKHIKLYCNSEEVPSVVLPKLSPEQEAAHRKKYSIPVELSAEAFARNHLPKNTKGWQFVRGLVKMGFFRAAKLQKTDGDVSKSAAAVSKPLLVIDPATI